MPLITWWKVVVLERFAQFVGRAGRAEFWWFFLANLIVSVILSLLGQASTIFTVLGAIYGLGVLIPSIAVSIRRLHDTGKSGWFLLLYLIPLVGFIILVVFFATAGNPGVNQYGPPAAGRTRARLTRVSPDCSTTRDDLEPPQRGVEVLLRRPEAAAGGHHAHVGGAERLELLDGAHP